MEIKIIWTIEDVLAVDKTLTKEQACEVLKILETNHDANVGINWGVIASTISTYKEEMRTHLILIVKVEGHTIQESINYLKYNGYGMTIVNIPNSNMFMCKCKDGYKLLDDVKIVDIYEKILN